MKKQTRKQILKSFPKHSEYILCLTKYKNQDKNDDRNLTIWIHNWKFINKDGGYIICRVHLVVGLSCLDVTDVRFIYLAKYSLYI